MELEFLLVSIDQIMILFLYIRERVNYWQKENVRDASILFCFIIFYGILVVYLKCEYESESPVKLTFNICNYVRINTSLFNPDVSL